MARWSQPDSGADWMKLATSTQARHWIAALASDLSADWPGPPVPAGADPPSGPGDQAGAGPAEGRPAEARLAETRLAETRPAETRPAKTRPAKTRPAKTRPAEARPEDATPTAEPAPVAQEGQAQAGAVGEVPGEGGRQPGSAAQATAGPARSQSPPAAAGDAVSDPDPGTGPGAEASVEAGTHGGEPGSRGAAGAPAGAWSDLRLPPQPPGGRPPGGESAEDDTDAPGPPAEADAGPGARMGRKEAGQGNGEVVDEHLAAADEWISLLTTDPADD